MSSRYHLKHALTATLMIVATSGFLCVPLADAADYYVSTSGNNSNPGTLAAPWRTIAYAVSSSSPVGAGDTIYVRGGTYAEYIQIGKSGATNVPITLSAYQTEKPILTTGGALGNILFTGQTNWTIQGLEIKDSSGGAGIYFNDGGSSSGTITVQDNVIHNTDSGDNASCIFIQRNLGTFVIRRNVLYSCNGTGAGNNTGIVVFGHINTGNPGSITLLVQNNEIYDEGVGFKIKHPFATDQVIRVDVSYNLIHDIYAKAGVILSGGKFTSNKTTRVHHNIIHTSTAPGVDVGDDFDEYGVEVDHNTMYNVVAGLMICLSDNCANGGSRDVNLHDNVIVPVARSGNNGFAIWTEVTTSPLSASDYNCFWNATATTDIANWGGFGGGVTQSLSQWQGRGYDARSVRANPTFVNGFHLQNGSACKNLRGNGTDPGAYETGTELIGPAGTGPVTPPAPTGLHLQ